VHFYDRNLPVYPYQPDCIALPKGRILVLSVSDSEFWCDASCLLE